MCYIDSGISPALSIILHFTLIIWLHSVFVIAIRNGHKGGPVAWTVIIILCYVNGRKMNRPHAMENIIHP
jgi:hypothetical protein